MSIPTAIERALRHVRAHYPAVTHVRFYLENTECAGVWEYLTDDGAAPAFGSCIDVSLLEDALDAAWEDRIFPATYTAADLAGYWGD